MKWFLRSVPCVFLPNDQLKTFFYLERWVLLKKRDFSKGNWNHLLSPQIRPVESDVMSELSGYGNCSSSSLTSFSFPFWKTVVRSSSKHPVTTQSGCFESKTARFWRQISAVQLPRTVKSVCFRLLLSSAVCFCIERLFEAFSLSSLAGLHPLMFKSGYKTRAETQITLTSIINVLRVNLLTLLL